MADWLGQQPTPPAPAPPKKGNWLALPQTAPRPQPQGLPPAPMSAYASPLDHLQAASAPTEE